MLDIPEQPIPSTLREEAGLQPAASGSQSGSAGDPCQQVVANGTTAWLAGLINSGGSFFVPLDANSAAMADYNTGSEQCTTNPVKVSTTTAASCLFFSLDLHRRVLCGAVSLCLCVWLQWPPPQVTRRPDGTWSCTCAMYGLIASVSAESTAAAAGRAVAAAGQASGPGGEAGGRAEQAQGAAGQVGMAANPVGLAAGRATVQAELAALRPCCLHTRYCVQYWEQHAASAPLPAAGAVVPISSTTRCAYFYVPRDAITGMAGAFVRDTPQSGLSCCTERHVGQRCRHVECTMQHLDRRHAGPSVAQRARAAPNLQEQPAQRTYHVWHDPPSEQERAAMSGLFHDPDAVLRDGISPDLPAEGSQCAHGGTYQLHQLGKPITVHLKCRPPRSVALYELRSSCPAGCCIKADGYTSGLWVHSNATAIAAELLYDYGDQYAEVAMPTATYVTLMQHAAGRRPADER